MSNTDNKIRDNSVELVSEKNVDENEQVIAEAKTVAKKRSSKTTKKVVDKVEVKAKTTRTKKPKTDDVEEKPKSKERSKAVASKTKIATKVKEKTAKSSKVVDTKKAIEEENVAIIDENQKSNKVMEKIDLAKVLGQSEIKVIPINSEKNVEKYPINVVLKNLGYEKEVVVRYTTDNWNSYNDIPLNFEYQENNLEKWCTEIELKEDNVSQFEYVIKYRVNNWTYWDNNWDNNYKF